MIQLVLDLWRDATPYLLGGALLLSAVLSRLPASGRTTLKHSLLFLVCWLGLDAVAVFFAWQGQVLIAAGVHQVALLGLGLVLIRLAGLAVFRQLLPALKVQTPRILEDIVVIAGYLLWTMIRLSATGVELSSLVATSAVITAVLAFAMQDTLGNILGGLALQLDNSLEIGDWVKMDELSGRVVEIQWRYTAILTRNGEKVVVPNSQLMKGKFSVIGDRDLGVPGWRRWIWFNVDYSVNPSLVTGAVERAVTEAEIANVAREPRPSCVAMEFAAGSVRYALRYWLLDPQDDDPTDSAVRAHVLATVQRNGWRMALPDQIVHMVQEGDAHREAVWQRELNRRLHALSGIELFASLDENERHKMAERLVHAPFAKGGVITRQGAVAHWLYIIVSGEVDVFWEPPDGERRLLTHLPQGSVFGEMGLMTGAPRAATVVAATDVECYRLDKAGFEDIIRARPELAESMSHILSERLHQIETLQNEYQRARSDSERAEHRAAIVQRIREFFGLK
ncbi:mechanosensitive ion channel family protein [Azospira restricta]|uniref:Mechanosensitive ion channel n=1 Tax=Azospira restricta TaxID=404405 RepID=A0A974Y532_9RHOO|nr:mechanosensitive ion channel family protein [Azospira restricta]QRJ65043.1 mechanosensitive ion channel [Azospira restricta]